MTIIFDMDDDEGTGSGLAPEIRPVQVHIEGEKREVLFVNGRSWPGLERQGGRWAKIT